MLPLAKNWSSGAALVVPLSYFLRSRDPGLLAPEPSIVGAAARRHYCAGAWPVFFISLSAFSLPGAARPGTPARGLLHDSPLDSRVQGLCPLTPEPPHTSL